MVHPYAMSIMDLLSEHFTLLGRARVGGQTQEVPELAYPVPHLLWTNRVRHAPTKALLSKPPPAPPMPHSATISVATLASTPSPWRAYPNSFNCVSPASSSAAPPDSQPRPPPSVSSRSYELDLLAGFDSLTCPEKEQDLAPFDDCYEFLVLDAPITSGFAQVEKYLARPLEAFEVFLAGVLCQACGLKVPDPSDLVNVNPLSNSITSAGGGPDDGAVSDGSNTQTTTTTTAAEGIEMSRDATKRVLSELKQSALEHGAVESFLRGDLVWDFGDVRGVTTPAARNTVSSSTASNGGGKKATGANGHSKQSGGGEQVFAGVDLKKVGKDGIVAPPLPPPGVISNLPNGAKKVNAVAQNGSGLGGGASSKAMMQGSNKLTGQHKDKKEKVLEGLRDDKLALRLARSLFK